ncbi:MAG: hypothetical protein ACE10D_07330 [Planctomycetota bacterium]
MFRKAGDRRSAALGKFVGVCLVLVAVLAGAPVLLGSEGSDRQALAERIREEVDRLQDLRGRAVTVREEQTGLRARLDAEMAKLAADLVRVEEDTAQARTRAAELRDRLDAALVAEGRDVRALETLRSALQPAALRMAERVAKGIPYRRVERAQALREAAQRGGLPALWTVIEEELRLMKTRELLNAEVEVAAGRRKHAYRVRLGLINELCVTEDGAEVGVASHVAAAPWVFLTEPEERSRVVRAVEILQERRTPRLSVVPFVEGGGK